MTADGLRCVEKNGSPPKTTPMPEPHLPTHNLSSGIRVVKYGVRTALSITKCFCNSAVTCKL